MAACGRRDVASLEHDEVRELALLYRQTAADLSTAREDPHAAPLALHRDDRIEERGARHLEGNARRRHDTRCAAQ